ncbi:hypothetical protein [Streptomyces sp. NPDC029674]|uniref:hypothetical protein n=1 Tax=Streptomyces sp. NPDC029674 TaxID=3365297 RepID=UPI00384B6D07
MRTKRGAGAVAALSVGLLLAGCAVPDAGDRQVTEGRDRYWDAKAGAADTAAFMKVTVPEGATGVVGAVQVNPREDVYVLSFVTGERDAEGIAESLRSEGPLEARKNDAAPEAELFGYLGLAEPQTLSGTRWAGVCPPCVGDDRRGRVQWIEVYVQSLGGGRARVYLEAF